MKLTSTQKMLAVIALIVLAIAGAAAVLVLPKVTQLGTLTSDQNKAEQELQQTKALLDQLKAAKANAALTQADILKITNEIPENVDQASLVIELGDVANSAGVWVSGLTFKDLTAPAGSASYVEIPLTLTAYGQWSDIVDYLRRLNGMTRLVRVVQVTLTPPDANATSSSGGSSTNPQLKAEIDIKAFVLSSGAQPARSPSTSAASAGNAGPAAAAASNAASSASTAESATAKAANGPNQ